MNLPCDPISTSGQAPAATVTSMPWTKNTPLLPIPTSIICAKMVFAERVLRPESSLSKSKISHWKVFLSSGFLLANLSICDRMMKEMTSGREDLENDYFGPSRTK
jgi:hypothetical protein